MIDNFEKVASFLTWLGFADFKVMSRDDVFVNIEIIQRKKDGHEKTRVLKTYLIRSVDDLMKRKDEIVSMCGAFGARAYINLNPKTERAVQDEMLKKLVELVTEGSTMDPIRLATHSIGTCRTLDSFWVVDVDEDMVDFLDEIVEETNHIYKHHNKEGEAVLMVLPTKNGYHLITHPFDLKLFRAIYPGIDVKKNNPTVLYL